MSRYAQVVMGAAGSGKSSYCHYIQEHCRTIGRTVHVVNLDPAAEDLQYEAAVDVRELISVEDAMDEMGLGPNGGLVFCMEYLVANIAWLEENLNTYSDEYLLFDCPGQIELYSHLPLMRTITEHLQQWNFKTVAVYLQDCTALSDPARYIAGSLNCLSAMVSMELPHVNILSKCDLVTTPGDVDELANPDPYALLEMLNTVTSAKHHRLNSVFCDVLGEYSMVGFVPLNPNEPDSIIFAMSHVDAAVQWGEDQEPMYHGDEEDDDDNDGGLEALLSSHR